MQNHQPDYTSIIWCVSVSVGYSPVWAESAFTYNIYTWTLWYIQQLSSLQKFIIYDIILKAEYLLLSILYFYGLLIYIYFVGNKPQRNKDEVVLHGSKGTWQEWAEGTDTSNFFTMDYSKVKRRRPIHNKSIPVIRPWNLDRFFNTVLHKSNIVVFLEEKRERKKK